MRVQSFGLLLAGLGLTLLAISGLARTVITQPREPGKLIAVNSPLVWRGPAFASKGPNTNNGADVQFQVRNIGGSPVRILSVKSDCGCTKPRVEHQVISPGKDGTVVTRATTFPVGGRRVNLGLQTDSPLTPVVPLQRNVVDDRLSLAEETTFTVFVESGGPWK